MRNRFFWISALVLFACHLCAGQKHERIFLSAKDTTANKYIVYYPEKKLLKGILFLIPGMFQRNWDVAVQTPLPVKAAQQGLLVVIPTFKTGIGSVGIDASTQESFLEILNDVVGRNKLTIPNLYIGGFSIGGTCAIKYAELALKNDYKIKPKAVFAIDSPLDFERMYNAMKREGRLPNSSAGATEEREYLIDRFKKEFSGTPDTNLAEYRRLSPYSFSDTLQVAIKPLLNLPLRLYTEPDILFWLDDTTDYSGMNAFDFAAVTNELRRMGHKSVELISTQNKGFRQPGYSRHPHSWSIVEPDDLIAWLLKQQ